MGMKVDIVTALIAAHQNADLLSIQYTDVKGQYTERFAVVENLRIELDTVELYTDAGFRTFKISRITGIG